MGSGKLILHGNGYTSISPDGSNKLTRLSPWKIQPKGAPNIQNGNETAKTPGGSNSNMDHVSSKDLQEAPPLATSTLQSPHLGTYKNILKILVSQQGMPQSLEKLIAMLTCMTPVLAGLTNQT